jgi:nitrogen fixation protein FixH
MSKFNWGHGIFIFFVFFVGTLITVLIASRRVDHSLVVDDYYAQDLAYQSQYNKVENNLNDDLLQIEMDKSSINFIFNTDKISSGTIKFYRPSDKSLDFDLPIAGNNITIEKSKLQKGKWKVKVDYSINNKPYYKEKEIFI